MGENWSARPGAPPAGTPLCAVADLADGEPRVVAFGCGMRPFEAIVVRHGDHVRAYVNECPHQPLPLNIGSRVRTYEGDLLCDHHPARFRAADGTCTYGPCAGASLVPIPVAVGDGMVRIAS